MLRYPDPPSPSFQYRLSQHPLPTASRLTTLRSATAARQAALDSRIFVYRPGDYANAVSVAASVERSALSQDEDSRRAGTLGFALPDGLTEGPVRLHFEYGAYGFSRISLGLLE